MILSPHGGREVPFIAIKCIKLEVKALSFLLAASLDQKTIKP